MNLDEPRVQYAVDVLTDLFPGGTVGPALGRARDGDRVFALAPGGGRPRLLVPVTPRGAAATALRTYGGRMTRSAQYSYAAASRGLAIAGPMPLRARLAVSALDGRRVVGIDDHFTKAVGREVSVAFHLTPARANRKPIIQLLAAGKKYPIGFAKVGVNSLTSRLVRQEASALTVLADRAPGRMVVPAVTDHSEFAGFDVLTLEPLPTWQPGRAPSLTEAAAAATEIAALNSPLRVPLAASDYWHSIRAQIPAFSADPRGAALAACIDRITTQLGDTEVSFTASHGDFSPWNMWLTNDQLLVWDWERYEAATPAGLDLLHFWLNDEFVRGGRTSSGLGQRLIAVAPEVMTASGSGDSASLAAVLYLVHIGVRYEVDRQADAGAELGRIENWLLPAVNAALDEPALTKRT